MLIMRAEANQSAGKTGDITWVDPLFVPKNKHNIVFIYNIVQCDSIFLDSLEKLERNM